MIRAIGGFRWELCRSSKGALWADPVEGGITGAFYDYVTFYKKNNKYQFLSDMLLSVIEQPGNLV